ncbi:hypothetical protein P7C71_g3331, partial [Lecanoromycetidae sp. Uapishka_2]
MPPNASNDDDGFFNDLSRQPHSGSRDSGSPQEQGANAQVETQLESKVKKTKSAEQPIQEEPQHDESQQNEFANTPYHPSHVNVPYHPSNVQMSGLGMPDGAFDSIPTTSEAFQLPITSMAPGMMPDPEIIPNMDINLDESFSWEMISLGLEEPMPMQEAIDEFIGTGWPMSIDERDIMTVLPASEEAYEQSKAQQTQKLTEAMTPQQVKSLSPFAGVVFVTHFFGLNLTHLHRPEPGQREEDMEGKFWTRHRNLDSSLSQTSMLLPDHLRLPAGLRNPNTMNPFLAFCLYVAARVFIQFLKKNPKNAEIRTSLELLLTAMRVLQRKNPLTESFLVQLNLDIEGSGLDVVFQNPDYSTRAKELGDYAYLHNMDPHTSNLKPSTSGCSPLINLSETSEKSGSLADTRAPKWNPAAQRSTTQVESPIQGQFTFRSVESEEVRRAGKMFPQVSQPTALPGVFPCENWGETFDMGRPFGPNPAIPKTAFGTGAFDTEMSDQSGPNNSTGLTPGSSASYNHSSSNTSYTPPELHHEDSTTSQNSQLPVFSHFNTFAPPMGNMFTAQNPESGIVRNDPNNNVNFNANVQDNGSTHLQENDPFKLAAGWDQPLGNTETPVSLTGMTPEGGWASWES